MNTPEGIIFQAPNKNGKLQSLTGELAKSRFNNEHAQMPQVR